MFEIMLRRRLVPFQNAYAFISKRYLSVTKTNAKIGRFFSSFLSTGTRRYAEIPFINLPKIILQTKNSHNENTDYNAIKSIKLCRITYYAVKIVKTINEQKNVQTIVFNKNEKGVNNLIFNLLDMKIVLYKFNIFITHLVQNKYFLLVRSLTVIFISIIIQLKRKKKKLFCG